MGKSKFFTKTEPAGKVHSPFAEKLMTVFVGSVNQRDLMAPSDHSGELGA